MCATITHGMIQMGSMIGDSLRKCRPMQMVYPATVVASYSMIAAGMAESVEKRADAVFAASVGMIALGIAAGMALIAKTQLSFRGVDRPVTSPVLNAPLLASSIALGVAAALFPGRLAAATTKAEIGVKTVAMVGATLTWVIWLSLTVTRVRPPTLAVDV